MQLEGTIQWLYDLRNVGVKLGLDNIRALLEILGHPETAFHSLHIAGTNGKGSVAAMVDAMLAASGVPSGMFSSPHLVRPNERIRLEGHDIADAELDRQLTRVRDTIDAAMRDGRLDVHPSFFEVITATALQAFRDHRHRVAVLEVGLGGRLDATNAVATDVSVVVSLALDHTKTLGGTLDLIAREKAGIVKPGVPLVSGVVQQCGVDVLRQTCAERGAEFVDARLAVRLVEDAGDRVTFETVRARYPDIRLSLAGRYQVENARVALAAFERLGERVGFEPQPEAVRAGLAAVRWPGRLQRIEAADGGPSLLLDAAHNPAGLRTLVDHLRAEPVPRAVLLFGATSGKPIERLLGPLAEFADVAVLTCPSVARGLDPEEISTVARQCFATVENVAEPAAALARARELAGSQGCVLVTGSLYLVGEISGLLTGRPVPGPVSM
jgi:dihydrofolate synthase/folylpolyglutamate synthase